MPSREFKTYLKDLINFSFKSILCRKNGFKERAKLLALVLPFVFLSCTNTNKKSSVVGNRIEKEQVVKTDTLVEEEKPSLIELIVDKDVPIRSYFKWMDSIVAAHNQVHNYLVDEYIIVHNNKWIMDTLAHTDYYYLKDKGIFSKDSQALLALEKEQVLIIPDSIQTEKIKVQLSNTSLDLNIPEFRLRIIQENKELYKFPVRVGKVGKRYMAMSSSEVDMKTQTGTGEIIRVNKTPRFANPVNNLEYTSTSRDDGKRTSLPAIPWLEPSINGRSVGQLIHPTTNLETLNKASSNGCIGLRESDAWKVYYYAPLGTKIVVRYDLEGINEEGETVQFENIYSYF